MDETAGISTIERLLPDEDATANAGAALAQACGCDAVIYLSGPLGAGKTTLTRSMLRALGHGGSVKSPTYTLVEPYEINGRSMYHFDLYRLGDPEELEFMGIRDYFRGSSLCMVEWPEKGEPLLPVPDLSITLTPEQERGRKLTIRAHSGRAQPWLAAIAAAL